MTNSAVFGSALIVFGTLCNSLAQNEEPAPISQWIRQLSVREDIQTKHVLSVFLQLFPTDSIHRHNAITALEREGPQKHRRFQCRLRAVKALLAYYGRHGEWGQYMNIMTEALRIAYEIDDPLLIADMSQIAARMHSHIHSIGNAMVYAINAADLQDRIGAEYFYNIAFDRYNLGYLLYHTREYEKAITETRKALQWRLDTTSTGFNPNGPFFRMNAWNTIGLAYTHLAKYDSAFASFDSAKAYLVDFNRDFWHGLVQGNIGDVYFQLQQYDTAKALLAHDYQMSLKANQLDNAANSLQWIARINVLQGKPILAQQQVREAIDLLRSNPNQTYMERIFYTCAEVFNALGNADSSYYYFQKYLELHDDLERKAALNRSEIARVMQSNRANIYRIQQLNEAKSKMEIIRNFSVALVVLLSALGFLYINRQRLKMRLRQREALERQRIAEAEVTYAKGQLRTFTQRLLEKTQTVEKLQEELQQKETSDKQAQLMGGLSHGILTEADWTEFKVLFDQVYPGFFSALKRRARDITPAEMRIAALMRLELTASDAASLLGISAHSARKTRLRLKGRLQLSKEDDVSQFINNL